MLMKGGKKGFTLVEMVVCAGITLFVVSAVWSVYVMGAAWSTKMLPNIEAQRIVRIAIMTIVDGFRDTGAGTDTISGQSCSRRNGISWATDLPSITSNAATDKITYTLESLSGQTFYILKNESPMKLYHNSTIVPGTAGITSLTFERIPDTNMFKVTAKAEKDICMGSQPTYHVKAELSETVFLRNIT